MVSGFSYHARDLHGLRKYICSHAILNSRLHLQHWHLRLSPTSGIALPFNSRLNLWTEHLSASISRPVFFWSLYTCSLIYSTTAPRFHQVCWYGWMSGHDPHVIKCHIRPSSSQLRHSLRVRIGMLGNINSPARLDGYTFYRNVGI